VSSGPRRVRTHEILESLTSGVICCVLLVAREGDRLMSICAISESVDRQNKKVGQSMKGIRLR